MVDPDTIETLLPPALVVGWRVGVLGALAVAALRFGKMMARLEELEQWKIALSALVVEREGRVRDMEQQLAAIKARLDERDHPRT